MSYNKLLPNTTKEADVIYVSKPVFNHFGFQISESKPVEYIRKDFFLEWAKEQSASCDSAGAMKRAYDKLIEKLNSL